MHFGAKGGPGFCKIPLSIRFLRGKEAIEQLNVEGKAHQIPFRPDLGHATEMA